MIYANRENLISSLNTIQRVADRPRGLPILGNVLIVPMDGKLRMTCTDLETEAVTICPAEDTEAGEAITLSAKKFAGICKSLPNDAVIKLAIEEDQVTVSSGKSKFKLATLSAADFPTLDQQKVTGSFPVESSVFKAMLVNAASSMAKDDARYYLNGMLLQVENSLLSVVATDGHRLACWDYALVEAADSTNLLPYKYAQMLSREIPDNSEALLVEYGSGFCKVSWGETVIGSKLIQGQFPDYKRVIPRDCQYSALVNLGNLRSLLRRVAVLKENRYQGVAITFSPGKLKVEAKTEDEFFNDEMDIDFSGDEIVTGFNYEYLDTALEALQSEFVMLAFNDANDAMVLRDPEAVNKLHVVMPMRI